MHSKLKPPLRILHLEDDPNDAALIQATLEAAGIAFVATCVLTKDDFLAALECGGIDLILSDYSMPAFDGLAALKIARAQYPDLPVIMVSGTLGEERAIDSLKNGATDYVLKERLGRLAPAVSRAMAEVAAREERELLEAQFIEGQKMDVIGQLVGGVAHDFNNMLAVIIGCSDMLAMKLGAENPLKKYTEEIRHASERSVGLTRQLLVFIRKETVQPVVLNLNHVVEDMEKMLRRFVDENIAMTIAFEEEDSHVKTDSGHVGQVLMNLVINARDAMPHGGRLAITTRNVTLDESQAHNHPDAAPGDYVLLSVADTGTGMTDEVKAHLFEAFFTTKPLGKGTGLGLATCRTIIQLTGGHIRVESRVGQGTTFRIYFPRVGQPIRHRPPRPFQLGPLPRGSETLLVVEDEPAVRQLACGILEAQGYAVLSAANGQDALLVTQDHQGPLIRLVVTDVIMPLMGGKAMAEQMKTTYPDLKVLFTSGYTEDVLVGQGVRAAEVAFLPKPYTPAMLSCKVREMLDALPT